MWLTLLLVGVTIGANNLAISLTLGSLGQAHRKWTIIPVFGVFEFSIPLVGLWLGRQWAHQVTDVMGWLPVALIAGLGVVTLVAAAIKRVDEEELARRLTSWRGLILLSAGLSVDNLIIGFGLGARDLPPLLVATTISLCSMTFSLAGLILGRTIRKHWRKVAEVGAGVLLLALAFYLHYWG
ncbi:MAG: manganese efflux pump [Gemmatimonadota bacterium]